MRVEECTRNKYVLIVRHEPGRIGTGPGSLHILFLEDTAVVHYQCNRFYLNEKTGDIYIIVQDW